jgi:protein CWC15
MTTAHRPTWKAAVGQANQGGWTAGGAVSHQTSALDAPAHTKLKFRQGHQAETDKKRALEKSLLALEEAEHTGGTAKLIGRRPVDPAVEERSKQRLLKQTAEVDVQKIKKKYDDSDVEDDNGGDDDEDGGGAGSESDLDKDDSNDSDLDGSDSDDSDEDEEAALQAELAKIRAEREAAARRAAEQAEREEAAKMETAAAIGNPLFVNQHQQHDAAATVGGGMVGGRLKRRWNDDVVFRNQAKNEPAPKKRFINDTVRNDFHKRFLNKFMR